MMLLNRRRILVVVVAGLVAFVLVSGGLEGSTSRARGLTKVNLRWSHERGVVDSLIGVRIG